MFTKLVLIIVLITVCYYAAVMMYDIFFIKNTKKNEEVIIDISKSVMEYEPINAKDLVMREEEQNKEQINDEDETKYNKITEQGIQGEYELDGIDEEERRYVELVQSDEDYAPINTSYEYGPLEFKKILEDSIGNDNLFDGVFNDIQYESVNED